MRKLSNAQRALIETVLHRAGGEPLRVRTFPGTRRTVAALVRRGTLAADGHVTREGWAEVSPILCETDAAVWCYDLVPTVVRAGWLDLDHPDVAQAREWQRENAEDDPALAIDPCLLPPAPETVIGRAARYGDVIDDDTARVIASWWHSPADVDVPITALAHGCEFDTDALIARVGALMSTAPYAGSDALPELEALRDWALTRTRAVVVTTWEISADDWETWTRENGRDGVALTVPPGDREVFLVSECADDNGDWVSPGEPGFPADPSGMETHEDGDVWVPGSPVDTAAVMIAGKGTGFCWSSRGGDPFDWGLYWEWVDPSERGDTFASRYINPYTGEVEIKIAKVCGFTPAEIDTIAGHDRSGA